MIVGTYVCECENEECNSKVAQEEYFELSGKRAELFRVDEWHIMLKSHLTEGWIYLEQTENLYLAKKIKEKSWKN
ncbi:MAG: hypothetical protein WA061_02835 [Microgenomates group bacterium]